MIKEVEVNKSKLKALELLEKCKKMDKEKLKNGFKWINSNDNKTKVLRKS